MASAYLIITGNQDEMNRKLDDRLNHGWKLVQFGEGSNEDWWEFWALLEKTAEPQRLPDMLDAQARINFVVKTRAMIHPSSANNAERFYWSFYQNGAINDQADSDIDPLIALDNAMRLYHEKDVKR